MFQSTHRAVHEVFPNKELEKEYNTVEALMGDDRLRRMISFIAKQDPGGRVKFRKDKRHFGRNG
jgi:hypothetical protein